MSVRNSGADLLKKSEAGLRIQSARITKLGDRNTVDVFHYQVRKAVPCGPAIQQICDIRMFEVGKDLPFHDEPLEDCARVHAAFDQLYGYRLVERFVGARRK